MDAENKSNKKRELIKTIAIVFLAVLLVLTFFSNTIMNRTLPQVAIQYVSNGSISTKIRGTGTIKAAQSYEVKLSESRKVQSVYAKAGEEVEAGDLLFVLSSDDSKELSEAQTALDDANMAYQKALIQASKFDYAANDANIQRLRDTITEKQSALNEALDGQKDANAKLTEAKTAAADAKLALSSATSAHTQTDRAYSKAKDDYSTAESEYSAAESNYNKAESNYNSAKDKVKSIQTDMANASSGSYGVSYSTVTDAQAEYKAAQDATTAANSNRTTVNNCYGENYKLFIKEALINLYGTEPQDWATIAKNILEHGINSTEVKLDEDSTKNNSQKLLLQESIDYLVSKYTADLKNSTLETNPAVLMQIANLTNDGTELYETKLLNAYNKCTEAYKEYTSAIATQDKENKDYQSATSSYNNSYSGGSSSSYTSADLAEAKTAVTTTEKAMNEAKTALETAKSNLAKVKEAMDQAKEANDTATDELAVATDAKATAEADLTEAQANADKVTTLRTELKTAQNGLEDAIIALNKQKQTDSTTKQLENLNIEDLKNKLEKAQEKVDELTESAGNSEIYSDVSGKIESVSITAGNTTSPDTALCTIEVPDMGYTVEISVTNDQAQKVQVGTIADVSTGWWSTSDTQATLVSMKSDPQNPKTNKILVFDVTGSDVHSGDSLSLSIGERDKNYDCVIPKSAIRSDSNGSFVLVVTSKSSPLGNRYYASRVDVTVTVQDDTNAAVTGGLTSGDCVITTSSAPVSKGDQVRMAET